MFVSLSDKSIVDLDRSLKPLLGSITWRVLYGIDNLSMEFGAPSLKIVHEPMPKCPGHSQEKGAFQYQSSAEI